MAHGGVNPACTLQATPCYLSTTKRLEQIFYYPVHNTTGFIHGLDCPKAILRREKKVFFQCHSRNSSFPRQVCNLPRGAGGEAVCRRGYLQTGEVPGSLGRVCRGGHPVSWLRHLQGN